MSSDRQRDDELLLAYAEHRLSAADRARLETRMTLEPLLPRRLRELERSLALARKVWQADSDRLESLGRPWEQRGRVRRPAVREERCRMRPRWVVGLSATAAVVALLVVQDRSSTTQSNRATLPDPATVLAQARQEVAAARVLRVADMLAQDPAVERVARQRYEDLRRTAPRTSAGQAAASRIPRP